MMSVNNKPDTRATYQLKGLHSFGLDRILLTDHYYMNATQKEIEYLLSFDAQRLLAGFYDTAGIILEGVSRYEGWESLLIGGHTLGHYLTACANAYHSANSSVEQKEQLLNIITEIISGLKECQEAVGTGYIFGAIILERDNIEMQFDHVENNRTNIFTQAWVPWYTMHKIFEGLISVAQMTEEAAQKTAKEALVVATGLGDWTYNRVSRWTEETKRTVIGIEYGGMNDCLYDLYQLTKEVRYAEAAHAFDQTELFNKVLNGNQGDNVLNNYHANTTIPKFIGALNRYISFMEDASDDITIYLEYAKSFWDMVIQNHTYITGGNSEWEHFGLDGILDGERTNCTNETCNAYNMLKLTKKLFLLTGEAKYADYYENTFLNSILSSQNPETGMTTYFQPMATGFFKVFGERYDKFWCCTGSGMENFTKLGESFYYHKDNLLVVNQFISSELTWAEQGVRLKQVTKLPQTESTEFIIETIETSEVTEISEVTESSEVIESSETTKSSKVIGKIENSGRINITIAFRMPDWLATAPVIQVNGLEYEYETVNGYAFVKGPLEHGTKIIMTLPMEVKAFTLPDHKEVYGFKYGPVVLSALLGTTDLEKSTTGVIVTIPLAKRIESTYTNAGDDIITVKTDTVSEFIDHINEYLVRDESTEELKFKLLNTDANLTFVPHYSQYKERYGIYWYFTSGIKETKVDQSLNDKAVTQREVQKLDTVQPGYGQYENDELHNMQEFGTGSTGSTSAGTSRYANVNGSFSYRMLIDTDNGTDLLATFKTEDNGKTIKISIGDTVIYENKLKSDLVSDEYDMNISLPTEILKANAETVIVNNQNKTVATFTFQGAEGEASARLCNFIYSIRA